MASGISTDAGDNNNILLMLMLMQRIRPEPKRLASTKQSNITSRTSDAARNTSKGRRSIPVEARL
jgi:hypothetical protein